jgi:hypothetical protein
MRSSIPALMTEATRGVLDTSVLIDHDLIAAERLPDESAITAVTLAELAAGPHATENNDERCPAAGSLAVGGRYLGSTVVRCRLGTNVRQGFCCRKSSRNVKQGVLRGLAHCLDRCGQWIATPHTQSR